MRRLARQLGVIAIAAGLAIGAAGAEARAGNGDEQSLDDDDSPEILNVDGVLVVNGRAMQLFTGSPDGARYYARTVNEYAAKLRGKLKIYAMIVPTAQTFYLPENYTGRVRHEPANIQATYAMLDGAVETVDVVKSLQSHTHENIYFATDHHWTGLAAYYAYTEFCKSAGLKPIKLDPNDKRTISPYRGSLYSRTRESEHHRSDALEYWVPQASVSVERWSAGASKPTKSSLLKESSKGYGVFLGGDHPLMVAHSSNGKGRRALLIKNSYGNPFAVYLVEHFETVVIVDYRKYEGSVLDLVDEYQITDLILLNGAITANAKGHVSHLARLLEGGRSSSSSDDEVASVAEGL